MGTQDTRRRTMGRRKIDIAYLNDDRVRKVTFCKRKGGLFKKADDLSKLCGVEVAVVILQDKKTCEYASTDMNRILQRYQAMQAGAARDDTSEIARLWTHLETQRREMEALTRELAAEKKMVEELRGSQLMAIAGMEQGLSDTNQAPLKLPAASMPMPVGMMPPNMTALSRPVPAMGAPGMPAMPAMPMSSMPMSQPLLMQPIFNQQNFMMPKFSIPAVMPAAVV